MAKTTGIIKEKELGIPRALTYYNYFPFLYGFFTNLGFKIILSDVTTKKTLVEGASLVVTETCLAMKEEVGGVLGRWGGAGRSLCGPCSKPA